LIDTIIFDLGGVLIHWDPMPLYIKAFDNDAEKAHWFLTKVCSYPWNLRQDAGRSFAEAIEEKIKEYPQYEAYINLYFEKWEDMLIGEVEGTLAILKSIKKKGLHRLLAITNWSAETFPIARRKFPFLDWFEGIVVSGEIKSRKPSPYIFQYAIETYQINPSRALFIDDTQENVDIAQSMGFQCIYFENATKLLKDLQNKMDLRF
jgi:2-haloacid dehalogenase